MKEKKHIAATPTRISENTVQLANGEIVKIPKRYCDKRKAERKIRDSYKPKAVKVTVSNLVDSQPRIPIRVDPKTVIWVRMGKCYKPKWIELVGSVALMDKLIDDVINKKIRLCQV